MKSLKEYKSLILKYELPYRSFNSTELTDLYTLHNETFNTNKKEFNIVDLPAPGNPLNSISCFIV